MKRILLFMGWMFFAAIVLAGNKLPQTGLASYYGDRLNHHRMSCGERYCKDSFVAAHRTLPFGTFLKVTNLKNHKVVIVRITDRGPRARKRIIDLSGAAATALDFRRAGLAKVTIQLALPEEIKAFREGLRDSIKAGTEIPDSAMAEKPKTEKTAISGKTFLIQGGSFKVKASATQLKKYLNKHGLKHVSIKKVKVKKRLVYKVLIGPVNEADKRKAIWVLKKKRIKGFIVKP